MRANAVRALAALMAVIGLAVLAGAVTPAPANGPLAGPARLLTDGRLSPSAAVTLGLILLVLARGLVGGRRLARHLLLVLVVIGLGAPVLAGSTPVTAVSHRPARWLFGLATIGALRLLRRDFPALPHPKRVRAAFGIAALGLAVTVVHTGWLAVGTRRGPAVGPRLSMLVEGSGGVAGLVAAGCAVVALAVALAAAPAPAPATAVERVRAGALVVHPDADSLAPFITRADKTYAFSPDGRAAIGYRVLWGVALASGDPVGARGAADAAIQSFLLDCAHNGWRPAVIGASCPMADRWRVQGMRRRVAIGDEAVLDVGSFTLASRAMRNVRQAVRRTHNAGVAVHIGPLDPARASQLEPVLRDWLGGRPERGFSMNLDRLLVPRPDCLVAVAYDGAGVPQGFARFAICAGGRVLTLDVAPRRADAPNGVVERLIVDTVEFGRARDVAEISLNFAGFRAMYARSGPAARMVAGLAHLLDRWIELGPLYRFTAKFHPAWRTRNVLLRSWLDLVWVGVVALRAELGRIRPHRGHGAEQSLEPAMAWSASTGGRQPSP